MKKIIIVFSVIILALVSMIIYEAITIDQVEEFNIREVKQVDCDLNQKACTIEIPGIGGALFELSPRPIKMNQTLNMKLSSQMNRNIEAWVDFLGLEMEMGFNRTKLKEQNNIYTALGFLPTCTENQMNWKTTLLIKIDGLTYGYEFKFLTKKENE